MKKLLKIFTLLSLFMYMTPIYTYANENFVDNNAISKLNEKNNNAKIILSEYNTGKIISKKDEDVSTPYSRLINKILVFTISEQLRDKKITLEDLIPLNSSDSVLDKFKIKEKISVKDAIFILEQEDSPETINSLVKYLDLNIDNTQKILDKLTLNNTELVRLEQSNENKSTVKNINYLVNEYIKNFPEILEITKNPEYKFSNDEKVENKIEFVKSETLRTLGVNFNEDNATLIAYSGNTRILITIMNITEEKEEFFKTIQSTFEYIFNNYTYKLALKSGEYDINNENIIIEEDIFDLFYKQHSEKDVRYFLMNNKILLFQNYNYLSANSGTVFANFKSNDKSTTYSKAKNTFIQDTDFDSKNKKDKLNILLERTQYFSTFVVLIYSVVFILLYVIKNLFRKED